MALANPLYGLRATFTDKCGKPLIGGKVFSYEGNSLTPKTTYTDAFMSTPNTNPVILDETGKADIFLDGTYRFQVFSRDGVLIEDKNNVSNILDLGPIIEKLDQFNTDFQKNISDFQNEKAAALEDFENSSGEKLAEFQQEINIAAAAGAGANGWTDLLVQLQDGSSLRQFIDIQKTKILKEFQLLISVQKAMMIRLYMILTIIQIRINLFALRSRRQMALLLTAPSSG